MKKSLFVLSLALLLSGIVAANAQETTIIGSGQRSCGAWAQSEKNSVDYVEQEEWLWGYVSAYNSFVDARHNVSRGGDGYGMAVWMDNYCKNHPLEFVANAADQLIAEMHAKSGGKRN